MRRLACSLLLISGTAAADNVLVWHDAALYTAPAEDAAALHLATLDGPRAERVGQVVPMHLVAMRGELAEVEPVADAGCTWTKLATNDDVGKLHLFVKKADLAPVLVKPFDKTFADGTRIALRPGVALVPTTTDGRYALSVRGKTFEVELPAASVGTQYAPEKAKPAAMTVRDVVLADTAKPMLGGQLVALGGLRTAGVDKHGDTALAMLDESCVALTVSVATKALRTVDDEDDTIESGSGFGVLDLRDNDYVPALTPLSTPDGHQVAYAAKPIYLASAPHGKTVCFDRRVRLEATLAGTPAVSGTEDKLRLCAPSAKVVHERLRTASSANGSATR